VRSLGEKESFQAQKEKAHTSCNGSSVKLGVLKSESVNGEVTPQKVDVSGFRVVRGLEVDRVRGSYQLAVDPLPHQSKLFM